MHGIAFVLAKELSRALRRLLVDLIQPPDVTTRDVEQVSKASDRGVGQVRYEGNATVNGSVDVSFDVLLCHLPQQHDQHQGDDGCQALADVSADLSLL